MKRTKSEKAITLVALIITIIVLLILAVVAIRAVQGDGIIAHAKNARDNYNQAQIEENGTLADYLTKIEDNIPGGSVGGESVETISADKLNKVLSATANTKLEDKYGNKITLPAGFKIVVDNTSDNSKSTSYTTEIIDVTKGIVIQDANENQFVWIPVGKIYTDTDKTEANAKTITLGRYSWNENTGTLVQPITNDDTKSPNCEVQITTNDFNYTELQPTEDGKGSVNGNYIAKNINEFYNSSIQNGGYFLGRYEASKLGETISCRANQEPYGSEIQSKSVVGCQDMYSSEKFTSDLVNSYAWDTAIVFIQTFGTEPDARSYPSSNKCTDFRKTGLNPDKYCNIYDLSGNAVEWTTEISTDLYGTNRRSTYRGGSINMRWKKTEKCATHRRIPGKDNEGYIMYSFRPILYITLDDQNGARIAS